MRTARDFFPKPNSARLSRRARAQRQQEEDEPREQHRRAQRRPGRRAPEREADDELVLLDRERFERRAKNVAFRVVLEPIEGPLLQLGFDRMLDEPFAPRSNSRRFFSMRSAAPGPASRARPATPRRLALLAEENFWSRTSSGSK